MYKTSATFQEAIPTQLFGNTLYSFAPGGHSTTF